ncbi:hypothetical protein JXA34_01875 [Patescibacteria group bacterium]|nr:hypothetical protein [Patescibacteria group bacterium]
MKKTKEIFGFDKAMLTKWFLYWSVLGTGFFILTFLITTTWIGVDVRERCMMAQSKYEGDCVGALTKVVDNQESSNREKNYAIWALGQLGDKRALPVLLKYYTGKIPDREPYDAGISQYGLKKAIKLIDGGFNISAVVWRR